MGVTSNDVAQAAGVSRATVSYVLNKVPDQKISADTQARVLRYAKELGYRPNAAARSLAHGRGSAVLLPLPGQALSHLLGQFVEACAPGLADEGFTLVTDFSTYASTAAQLDAWLRLHPAAVIDLPFRQDDDVREALRAAGVVVLRGRAVPGAGQASALDAAAASAREAQVAHLTSSGARNVVALVPPNVPADATLRRRHRERLRRKASMHGASLTITALPLDSQAVRGEVQRWLSSEHPPDAVAAYNDDYAIAVLTALLSAGLSVPEDVRVMGVDDTPAAALTTPGLTTIAFDFRDPARSVVDALRADDGSEVDVLAPTTWQVVARTSA